MPSLECNGVLKSWLALVILNCYCYDSTLIEQTVTIPPEANSIRVFDL